MRLGALLVAPLLLLPSSGAAAELQVKPFAGITFGGSTTFVDPDHVAGNVKASFGVSGLLLGNIFGVEGDVGHTPGFFTGGNLILDSGVTTITGNVVIAMPREMARYTLRPYVVAGAGVMRVRSQDFLLAFPVAADLATLDFGGGVTGFITDRFGIGWDVRYFRSVGGKDEHVGLSVGPEELSFWRAVMAFVIRP